jgi:AAA+ superfamily predicted ATPase
MQQPTIRATASGEAWTDDDGAVEPFSGPDELVRTAAAWVALLIERQIARAREAGLLPSLQAVGDPRAGSYIGDPDIEAAGLSLVRDVGGPRASAPAEDEPIRAMLGLLRTRLEAGARSDPPLPFQVLCGRFRLGADEQALLLVLTVLALEPRLRRMAAYLQDHLARTRLDAGTALALLRDDPTAANLPWELLAPDGVLREHALIVLDDREHARGLAERSLSVPDGLAAFIARGAAWLDEEVTRFARFERPDTGWAALVLADDDRERLRARLAQAAQRVAVTGVAGGLLLRGPQGAGKRAAVRAACQQVGAPLLLIDALRLPPAPAAAPALRAALRDAHLHGAVVHVENAEALGAGGDGGPTLMALAHLLRRRAQLVVFATELEERIAVEETLGLASMTMPRLAVGERVRLWRATLPAGVDPTGTCAARLGERYPLAPGDIVPVGADAAAAIEVAGGAPLDALALDRLVLERSRHNLLSIATPVRTRLTLDDVVLPPEIVERCKRIVHMVESQGTLAERWGLGRKVLTNRGVSALFSGPPGTGKTMIAGILGNLLGVDVFRIDLARIVSKWIGETEKNLSRLFDEAARTRAVLVFDEADSLFARRTEVKSSNDRHANQEINHLLQRMESFEGVIILTTNMEQSIDEAFVRRLTFKVRFPAPEQDEREALWQRMLPPEMSFADDVELAEIARRFTVTGGFIRNAVVRAALIALHDGGHPVLCHRHLLQAVQEELEEAGRLASA